MVKIRLRRMGSTHRPFFRVVVSDSRNVPTSRAIEEIGFYNPLVTPKVIEIDRERLDHWVENGAQATPTVQRLLKKMAAGPESAATPAPAPAEPPTPAPAEPPAPATAEPPAPATAEPSAEAAGAEAAQA